MSFRIHSTPNISHLVSYGIKKVPVAVAEPESKQESEPVELSDESEHKECQIINQDLSEKEEGVFVIKRKTKK